MCVLLFVCIFVVVVVVGCLSALGGCDALCIRYNVPRCWADIAQSFIHERFYFFPQSLNQFTGKTKTGPQTPSMLLQRISQTVLILHQLCLLHVRFFFRFFFKCVCVCCLLYTSPSPRDSLRSRMPSSA